MIVAWCQQGDNATCGKMDCSFHDGVFAGYAYEHMATALKFPRRHAASLQSELFTNEDVFGLKQQDLAVTYSDAPEYPSSKNLRRKFIEQDKKKKAAASSASATSNASDDEDDKDNEKKEPRTQNHLAIQRAASLFSLVNNRSEVPATMDKSQSIFEEDRRSKDTVNGRWKSHKKKFVSALPQGKALCNAVQKKLDEKPRANRGNATSRDTTKAESQLYANDLKRMKDLGLGKPFWVYDKKKFKRQGICVLGK